MFYMDINENLLKNSHRLDALLEQLQSVMGDIQDVEWAGSRIIIASDEGIIGFIMDVYARAWLSYEHEGGIHLSVDTATGLIKSK